MRYEMEILDRTTGQSSTMYTIAESEEEAVRIAGEKGYVVANVKRLLHLDYANPTHSESFDTTSPIAPPMPVKPIGKYRVIQFSPEVNVNNPLGRNPAEQLERLINSELESGWTFVRLESVDFLWDLAGKITNMRMYLAVFERFP